MTIKKRLFCSNILMILVPAAIVAFVGLLCTALLWVTLQRGSGMHLEDGEVDFRFTGYIFFSPFLASLHNRKSRNPSSNLLH